MTVMDKNLSHSIFFFDLAVKNLVWGPKNYIQFFQPVHIGVFTPVLYIGYFSRIRTWIPQLRLRTCHRRTSFHPVGRNVYWIWKRIPTSVRSNLIFNHKASYSNRNEISCHVIVRCHVSFRMCPYNSADFVGNADLPVSALIPRLWIAPYFH